jgi:hypothetical protein
MTTTTSTNGRLCNQIIRNLAVSLVAKKHNLKVEYSSNTLIRDELGISLFTGTNDHKEKKPLNAANYFEIYNVDNIDYNVNPNECYFQSKDVIKFLYSYLRTDEVISEVILKNPFSDRYNKNNDLFIHIRLSDAAHFNPGVNYYLNIIKQINYDNLYISSDSPEHDIICKIVETYPNTIINNYDEVKTIQFGSTCKNVILSHGSFSAVIGYLSFFSKVYYPEYEEGKMWFGDMFNIDGWIKCSVL